MGLRKLHLYNWTKQSEAVAGWPSDAARESVGVSVAAVIMYLLAWLSKCGLSASSSRQDLQWGYTMLQVFYFNAEPLAWAGRYCERKSVCVYGVKPWEHRARPCGPCVHKATSGCKERDPALTVVGPNVLLHMPDAVFLSCWWKKALAAFHELMFSFPPSNEMLGCSSKGNSRKKDSLSHQVGPCKSHGCLHGLASSQMCWWWLWRESHRKTWLGISASRFSNTRVGHSCQLPGRVGKFSQRHSSESTLTCLLFTFITSQHCGSTWGIRYPPTNCKETQEASSTQGHISSRICTWKYSSWLSAMLHCLPKDITQCGLLDD